MLTKKNHEENQPLRSSDYQHTFQARAGFDPRRVVEYFGSVCSSSNERVIQRITELLIAAPEQEIVLLVTSAGGPSGIGMSFYDTMRAVLRPRLVTVGMGDVDSSGVILFVSGETRFVTKHTTMLLHMAGRTFEGGKRFTARELAAMSKEDSMKDLLYADVVADNSRGILTRKDVLDMMEKETVLSAQDMLSFGLADTILE